MSSREEVALLSSSSASQVGEEVDRAALGDEAARRLGRMEPRG